MKSIKILLFSLFLLIVVSVNAQDEIYNDKKNKDKVHTTQKLEVKHVTIDEYTTEEDYNEKNNITTSYEVYEWEDNEEIYKDEKQPKRRRNTVAGEVIAEVIVEVFINTAFIIAAFWH
jgi:hypothetical protein